MSEKQEEDPLASMSLLEHLTELRNRIILVLVLLIRPTGIFRGRVL